MGCGSTKPYSNNVSVVTDSPVKQTKVKEDVVNKPIISGISIMGDKTGQDNNQFDTDYRSVSSFTKTSSGTSKIRVTLSSDGSMLEIEREEMPSPWPQPSTSQGFVRNDDHVAFSLSSLTSSNSDSPLNEPSSAKHNTNARSSSFLKRIGSAGLLGKKNKNRYQSMRKTCSVSSLRKFDSNGNDTDRIDDGLANSGSEQLPSILDTSQQNGPKSPTQTEKKISEYSIPSIDSQRTSNGSVPHMSSIDSGGTDISQSSKSSTKSKLLRFGQKTKEQFREFGKKMSTSVGQSTDSETDEIGSVVSHTSNGSLLKEAVDEGCDIIDLMEIHVHQDFFNDFEDFFDDELDFR